jgi:hypothetical protein
MKPKRQPTPPAEWDGKTAIPHEEIGAACAYAS